MALQCFKQMLAVFFGGSTVERYRILRMFPKLPSCLTAEFRQTHPWLPFGDVFLQTISWSFSGQVPIQFIEEWVRCAMRCGTPMSNYIFYAYRGAIDAISAGSSTISPRVLNISVYMGWESTFMRIDCHVSNLLGDDQVYHFYTCVIIQMQSIHDLLLFSIYATVRYLGLQIVIIPNDDILVYTTFYLVMIILQMMMIIDYWSPWPLDDIWMIDIHRYS